MPGLLGRPARQGYTGAMLKNVAIIALAFWLLMAVAMNVTLVSQEPTGPNIQIDTLADAFV